MNKRIMTNCPTCGKKVDKLRANAVGIFSDKILYFCSRDCKELFARSGTSARKSDVSAREQISVSKSSAGVGVAEDKIKQKQSSQVPEEFFKNEIEGGKDWQEIPIMLNGKPEELSADMENVCGSTGIDYYIKHSIQEVSKFKARNLFPLFYFIMIQGIIAGIVYFFYRRGFFLPLVSGITFQVVQIVRTWKQRCYEFAQDELWVLAGAILYSMPVIFFIAGFNRNWGGGVSYSVVFSALLIAIWTGRLIEEMVQKAIEKKAGLKSIGEDETIAKFFKAKRHQRSSISQYSHYAAMIFSLLAVIIPGIIILLKIMFDRFSILNEKTWFFASAVSLGYCPRLFRNNIIPSFFTALIESKFRGVRFMSESAFGKAGAIDAVVFRKRGGLAVSDTRVVEMIKVGSIMEKSLLSICLACEEGLKGSEIASAIVSFAKSQGNIKPADVRLRRFYPSMGVQCTSPHGEIIIGSRAFLADNGVSVALVEETARERERRGESVVFVSVGKKLQAIIVLSNEIRPTASTVCRKLRQAGISPIIISGDSTRTVEAIADRVGLEQVRAEVPIAMWPLVLERIRETGSKIAIVGELPFGNSASIEGDLMIRVGKVPSAEKEESEVIIEDDNLDKVADIIEIANTGRKYIFFSTAFATVVQVFFAGMALSGLVSPLVTGGIVNIIAGCLWFIQSFPVWK